MLIHDSRVYLLPVTVGTSTGKEISMGESVSASQLKDGHTRRAAEPFSFSVNSGTKLASCYIFLWSYVRIGFSFTVGKKTLPLEFIAKKKKQQESKITEQYFF
jgi:hypothetical protein